MPENPTQPNQNNKIKKKNRTLGKKEIYKYLRILGADIIKQVERKEKKKTKKNIPGKPESYSRQNYIEQNL